jgi:hypothetical protein
MDYTKALFLTLLWPVATLGNPTLPGGISSEPPAPATSLTADVAQAGVQGYVQSTRHTDEVLKGRSFHVILARETQPLSDADVARTHAAIVMALRDMQYGPYEPALLRADVAVVVRLGARSDTPTVDDVLRGIDPDVQLPTGVRYLQVEAYELAKYVAFVRAHEHAAPDTNLQFLLWETRVESRGMLTEYPRILSVLRHVANSHLGKDMVSAAAFSEALQDPA